MSLKKVEVNQTEMAIHILKETAEWLKSKGSIQWAEVLSGTDRHGLTDAIQAGDVYFYFDPKDQLAGMVAAWEKPTSWDQQLWEKHQITDSVVYVHRLIVRPNYRGKGYGKQIIDEIKTMFRPKVTEIRLDCLASNHQLIGFYKENEFNSMGREKDLSNVKFELFSYVFE